MCITFVLSAIDNLCIVRAYAYACVCVRQHSQVVRASAYLLKDCRFDSRCGHFGVVVVSLSKKLYSHCSSLPSCINGDLGGLVSTGKIAHPAININGYLV